MSGNGSLEKISVIVPRNPFVQPGIQAAQTCLAALDVAKLMEWWPGTPHTPHRDPEKVRAIQRSLDWKRVAQIAAYLLQSEIVDAPELIDQFFGSVYEPKKNDPGRQWPPRVSRVIGFQRSEYPTFSSILLHVNGARIEPVHEKGAANLVFSPSDANLNFFVIDGQHRINGAFFAVSIRRETTPGLLWEIPSEIFLDLDPLNEPPRRQAQIFIDINFNQKKVDRSLVADLFPTARGKRAPLDDKERAQDLGRKLLLEIGPLVGMIQIPGIKFGVKDVVTLATLNSAIEGILQDLTNAGITSLDQQAEFLALCLDAWFEATGRREEIIDQAGLDPENVAYQGRVVVSFLALLPACILTLKRARVQYISEKTAPALAKWLRAIMDRAGLLEKGRFVPKGKFKQKGYLGSGGLARFRDTLWAVAFTSRKIPRMTPDELAERASAARTKVRAELMK